MKIQAIILILAMLFSLSSFAQSRSSGAVDSGGMGLALASWNHDSRTLTVHGDPARKIYLSLNAKEEIDLSYERSVFALKNHEKVIKQNDFAYCEVIREKVLVKEETLDVNIKSEICKIEALEGSVY